MRLTQPQRRAVLALATTAFGAVGTQLGQPLGYQLASGVGRDAAELKDAFVWCALLTPFVCAAGGFWLAAAAIRSPLRRGAAWTFAASVLGSALVVFSSYHPAKTFGSPEIEFELLLPEGIAVAGVGSLDISLWDGKSSKGCYIGAVAQDGKRQRISGSIVLHPTNYEPTVSLAFHNGEKWTSGGMWSLPYRPDAQMQKDFTPWQAIQFVGGVYGLPIAEGRFDIRYRVRGFR